MTIGKFAKTSNSMFKGAHIGPGDHPVKPDPHIHVGPATVGESKVPVQSNQFYVDLHNPFAKNPYQRPQMSPLLNMNNPFANKATDTTNADNKSPLLNMSNPFANRADKKVDILHKKPIDISGIVGKNQTPPVHTPQPSEKWMLEQIRKKQEFDKAISTTELPRFNWK